ncbi:TniQ protein [Variovorax sp. YR750]|uniref:TniQ family protein n=1 Tax=Variovorax sp. YR750 TaxID=1884384 RepID=UPI0008B059DE|nr:TniQ family protein [Variovorax sp. YR750]SEM09926.1 TniQ protein [Variovorax sp. YR750]
MHGLTPSLWPVRYKPFPDELTSSWLVRLAHGMGLKVQTFCNLIFGNRLQVWNRDIDRLAPSWLLDELIQRTATPKEIAYATSLRAYEGAFFNHFKASGVLPWVLNLKMYHRTRRAYGQQFCAECLAADEQPYFRRRWRLAFCTFCSIHQRLLDDRCHRCGEAVAYFRMDFGRDEASGEVPMRSCHACGARYDEAPPVLGDGYSREGMEWLVYRQELLDLQQGFELPGLDWSELAVLRQTLKLLGSTYRNVNLHEHLLVELGVDDPGLAPGRLLFEVRPTQERFHLLQLGAWMMSDVEEAFRRAWSARAFRYNHLLKDFRNAPEWFVGIAEGMRDWRSRTR